MELLNMKGNAFMINTTDRLTEWAINKIKNEYPDDVALLVAVEGSSINGDGHGEPFDYFIPATERGNELAQTFIIGGVGNDLYPRTWERTERTANLDDFATQCLGKAKILYSKSKEDEERFEAIRQKLFDNLENPEFTYIKALEYLEIAMDIYRTMMFEERLYKVRCMAGFIHHFLSIAVGCLNGTYQWDYTVGVIGEVSKWERLPEHFVEYYKAILAASSTGELKSLSHLLIASTRAFISKQKPENTNTAEKPNFQWLADWYQELRTTLNRIFFYCKVGDADSAFRDACNLQNELEIVGEEFGIGEMDLLGSFNSVNLEPLSKQASELERIVIAAIERQGIKIKRYDTVEEFLAADR